MAVVTLATTAPTSSIQTAQRDSVMVDNVILAGAAKTVTVPTGISFYRLFTTALIYLRVGGTATVPAADTQNGADNGSGSIPILPSNEPPLRNCIGVASFSLIDAGAAVVGVQWYRDARTI